MREGLSPEDALRLNVLLAKQPQAIRVDESRMVVYALLDEHETSFQLNPIGKNETYVKKLREVLSTQVLGSPGGHPVYLKRWMRTGQMRRNESLRKLLLLGETEAVVAVVYAENLNVDVAQHAWWVEPKPEYARQMLKRKCIAQSQFGKQLAAFLIEFLPFETQSKDAIETIRLVLQDGLIAQEMRQNLWDKGKRKSAYYVGFMLGAPQDLLVSMPAHPIYSEIAMAMQDLDETEPVKKLLLLLDQAGQRFLYTFAQALRKPSDQDVVVALFHAMRLYFSGILNFPAEHYHACREIEAVEKFSRQMCEEVCRLPSLRPLVRRHVSVFEAYFALAQVGEPLLDPVFGLTDAMGSVMRKKISHLSTPIAQWLAQINPQLAVE